MSNAADMPSEKAKEIVDKLKSKGFTPRSREEQQALWKNRPKCVNHPKSMATRLSLARGESLCQYCDPEHKAIRELNQAKDAKKRLGKRRVNIPMSIIEHYDKAVVDPELIALREDVATWEAYINQRLKEIKESPYESPSFVRRLHKRMEADLRLVKAGRLTYLEVIQTLRTMLIGKVDQIEAWRDIQSVTETKRRLVETETNRNKQLGWSPDYCFAVIEAMTSIQKSICTPQQMEQIMNKLSNHPLFNNKNFALVPGLDLTEKTIDDVIDEKQKALEAFKNKDGIYTTEQEKQEED